MYIMQLALKKQVAVECISLRVLDKSLVYIGRVERSIKYKIGMKQESAGRPWRAKHRKLLAGTLEVADVGGSWCRQHVRNNSSLRIQIMIVITTAFTVTTVCFASRAASLLGCCGSGVCVMCVLTA